MQNNNKNIEPTIVQAITTTYANRTNIVEPAALTSSMTCYKANKICLVKR